MIVKGTRTEIAEVIKTISPTYPVSLVNFLDSGEWHFIMNGINVCVIIADDKSV